MKRYLTYIPLLASLLLLLNSCLDDNDADDTQWIDDNRQYLLDCENKVDASGNKVFEKIVPSWAPGTYVLMQWHNDRTKTEKNLSPLDNSTVYVTYELQNVKGETLQTSFSSTQYGDSIYCTRPNQNIIGFWAALTNMHVGDSVTMVIPSSAAYGNTAHGTVPAYSTLVYGVKLKAIPAYQIPTTIVK